jgi:transcription elongation GreA/GreB family factor
VGANAVVLTVTDVNGNSATCGATVTVHDVTAPSAVCQNINVNLDGTGHATITAAQVDNGSADACGIASESVAPSSFGCANVGANAVVLTVTDSSGNSATCGAVVTVHDVTPPSAVCQNITVDLDATGQVTITAAQVDNGSADACGIGSESVAPSSFSCANVGANAVVLTVTDVNGNSATCGATVTVHEVTLPSAVCQSIDVNLDATGQATIMAAQVDNGSSDVCGIGSESVAPSSFGCANVGANAVVLTVTDSNGNSATCGATVTVHDVTPPSAVCRSIDVNLDATGQATITAAAVDNGSSDACGVASESVAPSSFTCANVGANAVVLTVTDVNGNSATCGATVTVHDVTPPSAVCQNISVNLDATGNATITAAQVDNGSSDACGVASESVAPSGFGCANVGANAVVLTVTDVNGNSATCGATVTVVDSQAPQIACPADQTVNADAGQCYATGVVLGTPAASDNCGVNANSLANDAPSQYPVGETTVVWTVADVNGNVSTCAQTVTVVAVAASPGSVVSIVNNHNSTFTLHLAGTPGAQYYLVTSGNVRAHMATWTPVVGSTNTASSNGTWSCVVTNTAPAYYRSAAGNPCP